MNDNPVITRALTNGGLGCSVYGQEEIDAATALLKTPELLFRYRGEEETQCSLFEKEACAKTGIPHSLFVSSGTSALICCLSALSIGPGDEVIIPAYTYVATAAAVIEVGAIPVIAEIDNSLGLSPEDLERKITPYTKAVIIVHMQGVPARMDALLAAAKKHNLLVIEDACQAIGAEYKGLSLGRRSDAMAWSLNYYKVITCGESGVFFCNSQNEFIKGVYYSDPGAAMWNTNIQGMGEIPPFTRGGCRGNEISAAIARVQLRKLDRILSHTRGLKKRLISLLHTPLHYELQHVDDSEGDCGISFAFLAENLDAAKRFTEKLKERGLNIGSVYNEGFPDRHIYRHWESVMTKTGATDAGYPWKDPAYKGNVECLPEMCPQTLNILGRCLRLPIHMKLDEGHIAEIAAVINHVDADL